MTNKQYTDVSSVKPKFDKYELYLEIANFHNCEGFMMEDGRVQEISTGYFSEPYDNIDEALKDWLEILENGSKFSISSEETGSLSKKDIIDFIKNL